MSAFQYIREQWLRPALFFGNNLLSLLGGAITSASAFVLIGFWLIDAFGHGGSQNPYLGIILDFFLPALFLLGLILIPIGMLLRRARLRRAGQLPAAYPRVDFSDPVFRHGIDIVLIATFCNFVILGTATYRGVAYMDTVSFCGATCHVMAPEGTAYPVSTHSGVACVDCHIGHGVGGYISAKVNGTRQLLDVLRHHYPTPIQPNDMLPPASQTCLNCHRADAWIGDRIRIQTTFADDATNTRSRTLILLHVGGRNLDGQLSGIHGAHLGHIEYISTDATHQTIHYVAHTAADGTVTEYTDTDRKSAMTGIRRTMDCTDCHNRVAHSFQTPARALDQSMLAGLISPSLPYIHKQALALLQASYPDQKQALTAIQTSLDHYYQTNYPAIWQSSQLQITQAASRLAVLWGQNVFPFMKVTWGTHPNNLGHNDYPGCTRCHDGSHNSASGKSIASDCATCHNVLTLDDSNRKQLADLGIQ